MKINNYSYSGNKKPSNRRADETVKKGVGAGYIIMLIFFFVVFIGLAILLVGMRNHVAEKKKAEEELVEEVGYEGFKEIVQDTFSNKCGYSYNITFDKAPDNAYFMDDCILKELTNGYSYNINGNIVEKGLSGSVLVMRDDYNVSYQYGFTENKSLLDMDITEYLSATENLEGEELYKKGSIKNIALGESVSGTTVLNTIRDTLLNASYTDDGISAGEYNATFPEGSLKVDTGYKYLDNIFNNYPGELKLSISSEKSEETGQHIVRIKGSGAVPFTIELDEYRTIGNEDSMILKCYSYSEDGVFSSDTSMKAKDFNETMSNY